MNKGNPSFEFFPSAFYCSNIGISNAQIGKMFTKICKRAKKGDTLYLSQFSFIGRLTMRKNVRRPGVPVDVRRRVLAAGRCAHCSSTINLEVNHIIPLSRGGSHKESNFQPLCQLCNRKKSNRMESEL